MQDFFRVEGLFYRVMSKVWGLLILNLLMLLTSLPILTIGAAQTAGFVITTRIISGNETQIVSTYFNSFRKNFRQSTIVWGISLAIFMVLITNWMYLINGNQLLSWITVGVLIVTLLAFNIFQFSFFYISRYQDSLKQMVQNLVKLSLKYPIYSILLMLILVIPYLFMLLSPYLMVFGIYISIFVGISFMHFLRTYVLLALFNRVEE
jgi:uncharacterized membrane protein YesL